MSSLQAVAEAQEAPQIHVGRQPIFDRDLKVMGYELLYRESASATQCVADLQMASAVVIANSMLDFGLDTLTGGTLAFFNCSSSAWSQELFELLPKDKVVLEVLEDTVCDAELQQIVRNAKARGYRIALDDAVSLQDREELLPYVDIIKLELPALTDDEVRELTRVHKNDGRKVLAEKVETQEQFKTTKDAGCDYFQGYFFAKPTTLSSKRLPQTHLQTLRLLSDLSDEGTDSEKIAEKVAGDVALSVRILRYANSAAVGSRTKHTSIQHAISMIGFNTLRKWAQVIAMSGLATDKPSELMITALMRARFCELVVAKGKNAHPGAFTVGLFSLLDAMMDRPLDESFKELHLADEIEAALLRGEGELGRSLSIARAYEHFDWDQIVRLAPNQSDLSSHLSDWFVQSISQAQDYYSLSRT